MKRLFAITGCVILAFANVVDPLTWYESASDVLVTAPAWHTIVGLLHGALLLGAGIFIARERYNAEMTLIGIEVTSNVFVNLLYVSKLGLERFARGFAGEEYLSLYLVFLLLHVWLVIGLRADGVKQRPHDMG